MLNRRQVFAFGAALIASDYARAQSDPNSFAAMLAAVEADNDRFPGAAGQIEAKALSNVIFGAAQPNYGKSKRIMNDVTIRMIKAFEVSNANRYTSRYQHPVWPGKDSGVTIAIGYDLGYVGKVGLDADWSSYINTETRTLLVPLLGLKRAAAQAAVAKVQTVSVPYDVASKQFVQETLPKYVAQTEHALENTAKLTDDSLGALVSLTFNRGPSYLIRAEDDKKGQFREMRQIRNLMRLGDFAAIPAQIRSMKRIWTASSDVRGLIDRRETEARLFELGLA